MCVCGSLGKKLAKDAREGGTEKLSRHGVVPKEGPSNGSLCRAALAFSVPELGPKFGASSVFAKERGLVFVTHIGRIFRTQKHACDSDIVCARDRQSDTAAGWEHGQEIERRDARCILLRVCLEQVEACYTMGAPCTEAVFGLIWKLHFQDHLAGSESEPVPTPKSRAWQEMVRRLQDKVVCTPRLGRYRGYNARRCCSI